MGLGLFLQGQVGDDLVAAANATEAIEFSRQSVESWTRVVASSGTVTEDEIAAAREMSMAQFAPEPD